MSNLNSTSTPQSTFKLLSSTKPVSSGSASCLPKSKSSRQSISGSMTIEERKREGELQKEKMLSRLGLLSPSASASSSLREDEEEVEKGERLNDEMSKGKEKERDGEVAQLKKEIQRLNSENARLSERNVRLVKEVDKLKIEVGNHAAKDEGLSNGQVREWEKNFADQESLLAGYQKDAEKSFITIENMKKQSRRYAEILSKTFGPNWEKELGLDQDSSSGKANPSTAVMMINSPAMRTKRALNRMSIGGAIALPTLSAALGSNEGIAEEEEGDDTSVVQKQALMREYVEGIQVLLRSVEQRLLKRDHELDVMEKSAKDQVEKALNRADEVEQSIKAISV